MTLLENGGFGRENKFMKFEKLSHIPNAEHDWFFEIGNTSGEKPICICLRYFTRKGFRLSINLYRNWLIKLFGFNEKIIGV